jgi:stress response protein SCP2
MADVSYVLSVKSRNHLDVMSRLAVALSHAAVTSYDFFSSADQAYGTNSQIQLDAHVWGMIAGDSNQDGYLTTRDYVVWYNQKSQSQPDYFQADVNLDGQVNQGDEMLWMAGAREGLRSVVP